MRHFGHSIEFSFAVFMFLSYFNKSALKIISNTSSQKYRQSFDSEMPLEAAIVVCIYE